MALTNKNNGKWIIILIILGAALGFGGWITSESASVTTIAAANRWIVVAVIGAILCAVGFVWLIASNKGSK